MRFSRRKQDTGTSFFPRVVGERVGPVGHFSIFDSNCCLLWGLPPNNMGRRKLQPTADQKEVFSPTDVWKLRRCMCFNLQIPQPKL